MASCPEDTPGRILAWSSLALPSVLNERAQGGAPAGGGKARFEVKLLNFIHARHTRQPPTAVLRIARGARRGQPFEQGNGQVHALGDFLNELISANRHIASILSNIRGIKVGKALQALAPAHAVHIQARGNALPLTLMPNAEAVVMPRTGHIPMMERPQETAERFLRFQRVDF